MEQNILDDKDRAYLVELLSNLGDNPKSKMADHMGTRRDDIPGGKNSKIFLDSLKFILHLQLLCFFNKRTKINIIVSIFV